MSTPVVHNFPIKRPGFFTLVDWVGPDNQLALKCNYFDQTGTMKQIQFATRNLADAVKGDICLPTGLLGNDLNNLGNRVEDTLTAHTRMSCLISRSGIPGSDEFKTALQQGLSANLNTALGVVKVTNVTPVDGNQVAIEYQQGTGPKLTVNMDYTDLNDYSFAPETQLLIVPGSVKKQFSSYVHDYPNTILSQAHRDEIAAYVLALQPWI